MRRFRKAMLAVGTYKSPDGTIEVTPQRLKHWASTFRRMSDENLGIPMGWDHSDDPTKTVPVAFSTSKDKRRSAANNIGWLQDFKTTKNGDAAELTFEIPDEKAADKASKNLVEASPIIYPKWTDGKGREWLDCITHVDLVNHPVDAGQEPFKPADQPAIACSIRMGLDVGKPQLYRMADDDDKEKSFGGENDGTQGDTDTGAPTEEENPDLPKDVGTDTAKQIEAVVAHLALLTDPVVLPSDTDESNFFDRLLTALMTAKAAKDAAAAKEAEEKEKDDEDDDMAKATESQPEFAAMSLQARAAHNYAEGMYRKDLTARLDSLLKSGRCTPDEAKSQREALGAVKLSLGNDNKPEKSTAELWLESREALPNGAVWPAETRLRMSREVDPPEFADDGEFSDERAEEIVDRMFGKKKKQPAGV